MTDETDKQYPYPPENPDELSNLERRHKEYICPLCGSHGSPWEYGLRCENPRCPAREITPTELSHGEITVVVDAEAFRKLLLDYPEVAECLEN